MKSLARLTLTLCAGLCLVNAAWAEHTDRTQPVLLDADRVRLDDLNKTAIYEGHVVMTQGTMTIKADRIDVSQDGQGMTSGVAVGKPVYFRQKLENSDQYMEAEANRAEYNARTAILRLIGSADLKRGQDDLRGPLIIYDTRTERYQAQGSGGAGGTGRVHAVIQSGAKQDKQGDKP